MNIPIDLLESLILLAEEPSMKVGAEKLNISQPALSMQLRKLQNFFILPLFEFKGKRKVLTSFGNSVYQEAKRIRNEINFSFEAINRQYLDSGNLTLRIGGRRELLLVAKRKIHFDGKIELKPMSSGQAVEALIEREIDIAVSRLRKNSNELVAKEFFVDCPWLVVHKKWLKGRDVKNLAYDIDFFKSTPFITYSTKGKFGHEWLAHIGMSFDGLNVKCVYEDWLSILQMIELGDGYSIIPDSIKSNLNEVVHVELPHSVVKPVTYFFVYNKALKKIPSYKEIFASKKG
ncbi:MAG: LysR family transcriptional regulator [Bdellovibrionaceae bacterium]|nr:LysR family transcriptional regulator [Pseudobdellovibrionaceae bacterium]